MTELERLKRTLADTQRLCRRLHGYMAYDYCGRGIGPGLTKDLAIQIHRIELDVNRMQAQIADKEAV